MGTKKKVEDALRALSLQGLQVSVESEGDRRIVASVVWDGFSGMAEETRQDTVWSALRKVLSDDELTRVDFVFTSAPEEA